ncbi:MAG: anti-sigma factor family protein [Desulfomonilaceae bacterium]
MMDCQRVADYFGAVYEGDSDTETEKMVEDHLKSCEACREDFKWYRVTVHALANLEQVAPPNDFLEQLNLRIDKNTSLFQSLIFQIKNLFISGPIVPIPVSAVSLAFVTMCAFLVYNYSPTDFSLKEKNNLSSNGNSQNVVASADQTPQHVDSRMVASAPFSPQASMLSHPLVPYEGPGRSSSVSWHFPTVADQIGADNLTVESPQVDLAVETLKNILPDLQGRLVDERFRDAFGEALVGVIIPSSRYGDLTSALVNHGAIEVGARSLGTESPAPTKVDSRNVRLYIRFTQVPK